MGFFGRFFKKVASTGTPPEVNPERAVEPPEDKKEALRRLRTVINENLRVQQGGAPPIEYVDVNNALTDIVSRQNHLIFGRRGCGKSLLLHSVPRNRPPQTRVVYINCEDYKQHSFPNLLIAILIKITDDLAAGLRTEYQIERKRPEKVKLVLASLTEHSDKLKGLKKAADEQSAKVTEVAQKEGHLGMKAGVPIKAVQLELETFAKQAGSVQKEYETYDNKARELNLLLPELKDDMRNFFAASVATKYAFIEFDDFYQLPREMQPYVADYIHRLCKDTPLWFKIATLRHSTVFYADRKGQPTGGQERHDYEPINIDFTLSDFPTTANQLRKILSRYGKEAGMTPIQVDDLFMGGGFDRLVIASGGIPRDFLSILKDILGALDDPDARIGKDQVRIHSLGVWNRRVEELKKDAQSGEQASVIP